MGERNLGTNEWREAGIGARAEGDDGTGASWPCPEGKVRQDRWEGKTATSSGENSPRSYFLIREKHKWLIHTFFPAQIIQAATSQPMLIPWCRFPGTAPQTPPDFPAWLPTSILQAGKSQGSRQAGMWPRGILCSPPCAMRGSITLHKPEGISSPKIPNLAWARTHQQTGATQAFLLPSS